MSLPCCPDRERATAQAWLAQRPAIAIVARDRGGGYGEAIAKALPRAVQVTDRWHLMENASRSFLDAVRLSMRRIREVVGVASIDPALLTAAERIQYETLPWSNGQAEGQITRLKLVKRQMYGRGRIDLLQARLIGANPP